MGRTIERCIYVLTNAQYPGYVKIGYASDLKSRLASLNTGLLAEFVPYAVYETDVQNADVEIHHMIGLLNPVLRAARFEGSDKPRLKEFFKLEPEEAYYLLCCIANINGTPRKAYRVLPDLSPVVEEPFVASLTVSCVDELPQAKKPVTIHFLYGEHSDYRSFTSWADFAVQVCLKAIEEYGVDVFLETVLDPEVALFYGKTRRVFSWREDDMHGQAHRQLGDGLYMLVNFDKSHLVKIADQVVEFFPRAAYELIFA